MADDIVSFGMEIDSSAARKAKQDLNALAQSGPAVEQALKKIDGAGRSGAAGMRAVGVAAQSVQRDMQAMRRAALGWSSALGAVFAGFSAMSVIDAADQWGQYASRMKMATQGVEEYQHAQERMLQSANTTFRSISETRESFIQLSPVLREMGYTLDQSIDAVDAFSGLLVVSGANAERGANAMNALAKSLQKGKVDADAWMTIYSTADTIVGHLAASSGKSADEIRKLGAAGKLSGQMMAQALVTGYEPIIKAVEGMPTTVRDAFQSLNNQFIEYVGVANQAAGATQVLVSGINALSSNFAAIANGIVAAGAAIGVVFGVRLVAAAGASAVAFASTVTSALAARSALTATAATAATAATSIGAVGVAARIAGAAIRTIGGPLGIVASIIIGAATAMGLFDSATKTAATSADALAQKVDALGTSFSTMGRAQLANARNILQDRIKELGKEADDARAEIMDLGLEIATLGQSANANQAHIDLLKRRQIELAAQIETVNQKAATLRDRLLEVNDAIANAPDPTKFSQAAADYLGNINKQIARLEDGGDPIKEVNRFLRENTDVTKDQADALVAAAKRQKELEDARKKTGRGAKARTTELQNYLDKLTEEQATLGMTEAAAGRYRIETAKGTAADRERALAIYDQVQAWKEADKAIKQAQETSRLAQSMQAETDVFRQQQFAPVTGMGLGDRVREQLQAELQVRQQFAQKRTELDLAQQVESTRISDEQYQARLKLLQDNEDAQVAAVEAAAALKKAAEQDWTLGAMEALRNYADEANNVYEQIGQATDNAFRGMEDALVEFVATGKLNFTDLANSILRDLARIAIKQAILGPLMSMMGGWMGGGSGDGGLQGIATVDFATGGYTGDGGKYDPAGIVHKGEGVLNQTEIRSIGGPAGFAALRRAIRGPGHAAGGMGGHPALPGAGQASQQRSVVVQMTINTPDANSFRKSQGQISRELGLAANRAIARV